MRKIPILTLIILAALAVLNAAAYQSDDGLISVNPIEYDAKTTAKMDGQVVDVYVYSKNVKLKINTSLKEIHVEIYELNSKELVYFNFTSTFINCTLPKGNYTVYVGACDKVCHLGYCMYKCSEFDSYGKFIIEVNKTEQQLVVESVFANNTHIPRKYAFFYCGGQNVNPPLYLKNLSNKAKSLVIVVEDPDANNFLHWLAWNVEPVTTIPESIPNKVTVNKPNMTQGMNSYGFIGYGGPCPPPGERHHYYFNVYVLDTMLNLPTTATKDDVLNAMKGHVIQKGLLIGLFP